jgi:hypothetical protein
MRLDAISQDDTDVPSFPGGPSNHNNALRTLRRMLGKAEDWRVLRAAPRIKLQQERERERIIDEHVEAKLFPFCQQPLRDVLMIMRDAGMRNQKEVFTMRWEHLDWLNSRYFVYDNKNPEGTKARSDQSACSAGPAGAVFRSKGRLGISLQTGKVRPSHERGQTISGRPEGCWTGG